MPGFASRTDQPPALEWEGEALGWYISSNVLVPLLLVSQVNRPKRASTAPSPAPNLQPASLSFGFGLFVVPPLSGESGFGSIGRSAAAAGVGRVFGEFGFGFFDHSLPVVFWDRDLKIESHEIEGVLSV
ncbi:hypothetical protein Scep_022075 [Stephania cephalantha]|uniref:Uncharacterized protein n=1 Tax=Stephania cephalantha TaxID=152367 RepID=A0AAP0F4N4_9MAGN